MEFIIGRKYLLRNGDMTEVIEIDEPEGITYPIHCSNGFSYTIDGEYYVLNEDELDLVVELVPEDDIEVPTSDSNDSDEQVIESTDNGSNASYYDFPEDSKELQDLIEHRGMNFAVGNIFKASYRLGLKKHVETKYDLEKIIYFANRELERING